MRFGLVPESAKLARPWATPKAICPPDGLVDVVSSVEAQIDEKTQLGRAFRLFVYPDTQELERLQAGQPIEFTVYAHQLVPVSAEVPG